MMKSSMVSAMPSKSTMSKTSMMSMIMKTTTIMHSIRWYNVNTWGISISSIAISRSYISSWSTIIYSSIYLLIIIYKDLSNFPFMFTLLINSIIKFYHTLILFLNKICIQKYKNQGKDYEYYKNFYILH